MATDYFTKWVDVVPLKSMMHKEVINFVMENIVYRFAILQSLTTDQGSCFMSHQFKEFIDSLHIKLLNSSPSYAQAWGTDQEDSNRLDQEEDRRKAKEVAWGAEWSSMGL
jgi:hypothetical protein